jgi:hypothetical protein
MSMRWEKGEVAAYRLATGDWAAIRCTGETPYDGGMWPVFEVLDWRGQVVPPDEMLCMLPARKGRPRPHPFGPEHDWVFAAPSDRFAIVEPGEAPEGRLRRLTARCDVHCSEFGPALASWSTLDEVLRKEWGLE